jgi:hypothetical protein
MKLENSAVSVRLLYVSRARDPQTTTVTTSILLQAQVHNRVMGITGLLCQGQGFYFQMLEGNRSRVNALYRRICLDHRHKDVELISYEDIGERRFSQWSMALVQLSADDPLVQMQHPEFDPYSADAEQVIRLLGTLIESAQLLTAP